MHALELEYLTRFIQGHMRQHFHDEAANVYQASEIVWIKWEDRNNFDDLDPGTIVIPFNAEKSSDFDSVWRLDFRGTGLAIWGRLPNPGGQWRLENVEENLWYVNRQGVFMPAFDLATLLMEMLTFKEEIQTQKCDKHGRFVSSMSPRAKDGRIVIPIVNNVLAALLDRCIRNHATRSKSVRVESIPFAKPVTICLSHDLDQLLGNDIWTQAARLWRLVSPLKRIKPPDFRQLSFILANIRSPRSWFIDDLLNMINAEKAHGFRSVQYVLCGTKGRYGARTSTRTIRDLLVEIPEEWPVALHYNYDTHLNGERFSEQSDELALISGVQPNVGRAHYLRMDAARSFRFWSEQGIEVDESLGYSDKVGYRAGIAGPFHPFDPKTREELPIISLPLVAMESAIVSNFGDQFLKRIEAHIRHLSIVGGTFTMLFHPGRFETPESTNTAGMYHALLKLFQRYNAKCIVPAELLD